MTIDAATLDHLEKIVRLQRLASDLLELSYYVKQHGHDNAAHSMRDTAGQVACVAGIRVHAIACGGKIDSTGRRL